MRTLILTTILISVLNLLSCSDNKERKYDNPDPELIWEFSYTIYADDVDWVHLNFGFGEEYWYADETVENWSYGSLDTSSLGEMYVDGVLVHSSSDGNYTGDHSGKLVEYHRYHIAAYVNDECLFDGERFYESEIYRDARLNYGDTENSVGVEIGLKRKPEPGEVFFTKFQMWKFVSGYYL